MSTAWQGENHVLVAYNPSTRPVEALNRFGNVVIFVFERNGVMTRSGGQINPETLNLRAPVLRDVNRIPTLEMGT